jgi:iron complex transport system substrate-binding protein
MKGQMKHTRSLLSLILVATFTVVTGTALRAQGRDLRVASANVCADQLLIALVGAPRTLALSRLSRDEDVSFYADRARRFRVTGGSGEELVRMQPDLVLLGHFDSAYTRRVLESRGIPYMLVDGWDSVAKLSAGLAEVGARLGAEARSRAIVRRRVSFLILQRRGFVLHDGLLASVLESGGMRNASSSLRMKGSGLIDIERIVRARPDFLIVDARSEHPADQGLALLQHPALESLWGSERRLLIPDVLSVCGGPSTPTLIQVVREQIENKVLPQLD